MLRRSGLNATFVLIAALCWTTLQAEVLNAAPAGFTLKHSVDVKMPPTAAWAALADVGRWWDPEHTYSGDARNLELQPVVPGCFCEKLGMYGGIEHMRVVYAQPPRTLRLTGALGPLQEFAVTGSLTWQIEVAGGGSRITVSYSVGGYADRPLDQWAPVVDEVLGTQVQRLGRYVSTGNPEAPATP